MPATKTFEGRIRLKADTEANWNAHPITPLSGELIIYSADGTHNYSRLKVGDGSTIVTALPFIDAGTIDGNGLPEGAVLSYMNRESFPYPGIQNTLYIDLSTNVIYCYNPSSGYTQLSNFTYTFEKASVSQITEWKTGTKPTFSSEAGILRINSGLLPTLTYQTFSVIKDATKEVLE